MTDDEQTILGIDEDDGGGPVGRAAPASLIPIDTTAAKGVAASDLTFSLTGTGPLTVGRESTCDIVLPVRRASRLHARFFTSDSNWVIEDNNSQNGVYVNDVRVTTAVLKHGDKVAMGGLQFVYTLERPDTVLVEAAARSGPTEDDPNKTQIFGSSGFAQQVIRGVEQGDKEADSLVGTDTEAEPRAEKKKSTLLPVIAVVGLLFVAGGAYVGVNYDRWVVQGEISNLIEKHEGRLKKYREQTRELAQDSHDAAWARIREQVAKLRLLRNETEQLLADTPVSDKDALRQHLVNVVVTLAEHRVATAVDQQNIAEARRIIDQTRDFITDQTDQFSDAGTAESLVEENEAILRLMEHVVAFRSFTFDYGPAMESSPRPPSDRLERLQARKQAFSDDYRASRSALTQKYIYLRAMAQTVDERDMRLVSEWSQMLADRP